MSLSASLNLKQSQSLVMTPQLMQSIRLLQFDPHELLQFVESQVQSNPLLEITEVQNDNMSETSDIPEPGNGARSDLPADTMMGLAIDDGEMGHISQMENTLDVSMKNVYQDDEAMVVKSSMQKLDNYPVQPSGELAASGADIDFDSFEAKKPSLRDIVSKQIGENLKCPTERIIAGELLDHLDDAGYLATDLSELSQRLSIEPGDINGVLRKVQRFDPAGIFARDLSECLALQLERKNHLDPAMQNLLANLELLGRKDFNSLRKLCGVDEADLVDMVREIQALDPKPGTLFDVSTSQTVVPDVIVKEADDGSWLIEINPETLPRVLVNQSYFATVTKNIDKASSEYNFMNECLQSANWLSRSLDQRVQTIIKVASEVVSQQNEFLRKGVSHLKPLNLKMVAEAIGMHESTVSRVTSNKYMLTPRGLFELKYFFTVSISGTDGADAHSAEAIRHRIKELVQNETLKNILSDDEIVKILKEQDIEIARRTVAKYRESMNIASSVQRRREKKLLAQDEKIRIPA